MKLTLTIAKKQVVIAFVASYIAAMCVCTFFDREIAERMFCPDNLFGKIFEVIGVLPPLFAGIFFGEAFILTRSPENRALSWVIGSLGVVGSSAFSILAIVNLNPPFVWLFVAIIVLWSVGSYFLIMSIRKHSADALRKVAVVGLIVALVAILGQTLAKHVFNRPRYITLNADTPYTPWYVHHPFAFDSSFPSGHASQTTVVFVLLYLPTFCPKINKKVYMPCCTALCALLIIAVSLSRMTLGVHYATDILTGFALTFTALLLCDRFIMARTAPAKESAT